MAQVIFALLLAASLVFFIKTSVLFGRAVFAGTPEARPRLDELPARLVDVGIYFFGQKKVAEEGPQHRTSKHHLIIFWGFLIITIATVDILVSGVIPSISLRLLPDLLYQPLYLLIDVMNLLVLLMIVWAFTRRIIVHPSRGSSRGDGGAASGRCAVRSPCEHPAPAPSAGTTPATGDQRHGA